MPASTEPKSTACNRTRWTLMPTLSAASGCSPTARMRRPHRVRNRIHQTSATAANIE